MAAGRECRRRTRCNDPVQPRDEALNKQLVNKIKATRKIYVSGTAWDGKPACRFAVSNWMTDAERDLPIIKQVLQAILSDKESVQS